MARREKVILDAAKKPVSASSLARSLRRPDQINLDITSHHEGTKNTKWHEEMPKGKGN